MKTTLKRKKNRIWELDFLRGFAILLVVFDHLFYDYGMFFGAWRNCGVPFLEKLNSISLSYLNGDLRFFWRPAFLFIFFSVSGICTALSRNNFLRGIKLWVVAVFITLISFLGEIVADTPFILFGVLHCLAVVIVVYAIIEFCIKGIFFLVEKLRKKESKQWVKTLVFTVVCLAVAGVTLWLHFHYNPRLYDVESNYTVSEVDGKKWGMFFFSHEWWTSDYFPLFPFISFFFFGAALSKILYPKKRTLFPLLQGPWNAPVSFAGKHSLIVYLLGQVLGIGLGALLSLAFLGKSLLF